MHWWKELHAFQGHDKSEIWNSVSVHQTVRASAIILKTSFHCFDSMPEIWSGAVGQNNLATAGHFLLAIVNGKMFSVSLERAQTLLLHSMNCEMHKCIGRACCKPLNMMNLVSGFVILSGGTLFWHVIYRELLWLLRWQCYHCHISGNQLFTSTRYVNVCILH